MLSLITRTLRSILEQFLSGGVVPSCVHEVSPRQVHLQHHTYFEERPVGLQWSFMRTIQEIGQKGSPTTLRGVTGHRTTDGIPRERSTKSIRPHKGLEVILGLSSSRAGIKNSPVGDLEVILRVCLL